MVMEVIVIAMMNTPNAFATIDDNENSLNVKVLDGYPVLSEERDI